MPFPGPTETAAQKSARQASERAERFYRQAIGNAEDFRRRVHGVSVQEAQAFFDQLGDGAGRAVETFVDLVTFINSVAARNGLDPYEPERVHELTTNADGTVTVTAIEEAEDDG